MLARPKSVAGALALSASIAASMLSGIVGASGDARTISFYHIHTKETLTVLYRKDGRYLPDAMKKINWILRDWRSNEQTTMDPKTIDIAWEMHAELGSTQPIHIISGYRSRNTNEMLRKTRGGQASQSQHITGKAIDIHFPDVPIRQLRYSAMIRERGGVGYYPTSALPFVHVDTARVRHWPRMPHDELALLFPRGQSKHMSAEGRSLQPGDAQRARLKQPKLAQQVAHFFDLRSSPRKPVLVASADPALPLPPQPQPAVRPQPQIQAPGPVIAALIPPPQPRPQPPKPSLVQEPRLVERSSRFAPLPSSQDRQKLDELVSLAALGPVQLESPRLIAEPKLVARAPQPVTTQPAENQIGIAPQPVTPPDSGSWDATIQHGETGTDGALASAPALPGDAVAALIRETNTEMPGATQWIAAPAYDEDHPEELAYQPFPILPLLTETASADDPVFARLVHHDVARTFDMLDDEGRILPMRLRPGLQTAKLMFAQQFTGQAVDLSAIESMNLDRPASPVGLAERSVRTSPR